MESRYSRNRIYLTEEEQTKIKNYPILLGGAGIGSTIAECALRLGFENITIIDGDKVELSNLNRQNFLAKDLTVNKTEAIKQRLLSINPDAKITVHNLFLTTQNVEQYINGHKIAINALDFSTEVPLVFDEICQKKNIPVLHPYNLGWGGLVTVIKPNSLSLKSLALPNQKFSEIQVVKYVSDYLKFWKKPQYWIDEVLEEFLNEKKRLSPPQLSIGTWIVAGMCTNLLFDIATQKTTKVFPEFYFSSIKND